MAVYGHTFYPTSTFQLTVVLRDEFDQLQNGYEDILDSEQFEMRRIGGSGNSGYRIPQVTY